MTTQQATNSFKRKKDASTVIATTTTTSSSSSSLTVTRLQRTKQREKSVSFLRSVSIRGITAIILATLFAAQRYFREGPFTPWTCSVFGYRCDRRYDVQFRGYVHDDYVSAGQAFKNNFYAGEEVGAAAALYVDGELVMDMQGGWQTFEKRVPYTHDTLQLVFSSTKVLTAIVVAQFVDKGVLSYDERIATYWPEFAQGNKENVTLGDLMQHAGGVAFIDQRITSAEAEDPERFARILAAQPHNFAGVRKRCYHATTRGWYINEILRRVANRTVNDVALKFNKEYDIEWNLKPYQQVYDDRIAWLYRGPILHQIYRILKIIGPVDLVRRIILTDDIVSRTLTTKLADNTLLPSENLIDLRLRRIESPSYSGYTNARSMAKLAAMMANGGKAIVQGEPDLLTPEGYATATELIRPEYDLFFRLDMSAVKGGWNIFKGIDIDGIEFVGWSGIGGSVFFWNHEYKIGFAYCMNALPDLLSPDDRSISILTAAVKQVLQKKSLTFTA